MSQRGQFTRKTTVTPKINSRRVIVAYGASITTRAFEKTFSDQQTNCADTGAGLWIREWRTRLPDRELKPTWGAGSRCHVAAQAITRKTTVTPKINSRRVIVAYGHPLPRAPLAFLTTPDFMRQRQCLKRRFPINKPIARIQRCVSAINATRT
jgi:hypothetical protein